MNTQTTFGKISPAGAVGQGDETSKDFDNFVYLLSHDVRASVRALLELPTWIKEDLEQEGHAITGSLATHIALMDTHSQRLDRMLCDLLSYSRVGRNQEPKSIDVAEVVEMVVDQIVPPKRFQVEVDIDDTTLWIGEPDLLTLFSALLTNAIKHHHRDTGTIRIASWRDADEHVIVVSDDGPGIPPLLGEKVFEAMRTLKPRDEIEGSGMGLTIVRKIVELYDGRLNWLQPEDGQGTILEMRFPTRHCSINAPDIPQ